MTCPNEEGCELKKRVEEIASNTIEFQRSVMEMFGAFKEEVTDTISSYDARHTSLVREAESSLRDEQRREVMAMTRRIDTTIELNNERWFQVAGDLGEIKGALGLKTDKEETGQLKVSVMNRLEVMKKEAQQSAQLEIDRMKSDTLAMRNKVIFIMAGVISSGLFFALGILFR
jgi:hypothetical protein